jgi:thiol-disulfide isomerase/thioredoxin
MDSPFPAVAQLNITSLRDFNTPPTLDLLWKVAFYFRGCGIRARSLSDPTETFYWASGICSKVMTRNILLGLFLLVTPVLAVAQTPRPAPPVVLRDLKGRTVRLTDFKGKVVLLNFWATWCPPCRAEIPELVKWQQEYGSKGLQIIGVTYPPTNRREVQRFIRALKVTYPILLGYKKTKALFDAGETLPLSVVIDRKGKVRENIEGILLSEEFNEKVKPLLERIQP